MNVKFKEKADPFLINTNIETSRRTNSFDSCHLWKHNEKQVTEKCQACYKPPWPSYLHIYNVNFVQLIKNGFHVTVNKNLLGMHFFSFSFLLFHSHQQTIKFSWILFSEKVSQKHPMQVQYITEYPKASGLGGPEMGSVSFDKWKLYLFDSFHSALIM